MGKNKVEIGAATEIIIRDVKVLARSLQEYLISCGVKPLDTKMSTLIRSLKEVNAIKPNTDYLHVRVNEAGYITDMEDFGDIIIKTKLPADITRGYYKVENKRPVVDELMKRKLWEV